MQINKMTLLSLDFFFNFMQIPKTINYVIYCVYFLYNKKVYEVPVYFFISLLTFQISLTGFLPSLIKGYSCIIIKHVLC